MTYIIPIYSLSSCYDIEKNFIPNDIIYVHNAEEVIEKKTNSCTSVSVKLHLSKKI